MTTWLASSRNILPRNAQYLAEEYSREHVFMRDLKQLGRIEEQVNSTRPFPSTELLTGYRQLPVNKEGPAPTTIWNYFVEWYSDQFNQVITAPVPMPGSGCSTPTWRTCPATAGTTTTR